jgi:SOS-response transcriptional repressor LexA
MKNAGANAKTESGDEQFSTEIEYSLEEENKKYPDLTRTYISSVLEHCNLSATSLAKLIGVSTSSITRALDEKMSYQASPMRLYHIYRLTQLPLPKELAEMFGERDAHQPLKTASSPSTLIPILQILQHGGVEIVDHIDRPPMPVLKGRNAFGLYVQNDKMEPVLKMGHLVFADPARLPKPDDDVVVHLSSKQVAIYRFISTNKDFYMFKTFRPDCLIHLQKSQISRVDPIVMIDRTA